MRARVARLLLLTLLLAVAPPAAFGEPAPERVDLLVATAPGVVPPPLADARVVPLRVIDGYVVLDAPRALADALRAAPGVARVDVAAPLERHGYAGPHDPNLRLTRAHAPGTEGGAALSGRGVTVAVVDSGIDATHPDLANRVARNVRLVEGAFVDAVGDLDGHGTHVAGIVAGDGASSGGRVRGVAPGATLVGVDISGRFTTASALLAYDWLYANQRPLQIGVVVNAWGRVGNEPFDADDAVVRAIDRLVARGVVVLFSASNHGPAPASLSVEAQNPRVITVGATDVAARLMDYSSRGPVHAPNAREPWVKPDVVAPGEAVVAPRSLQTAPRADDPDALHTVRSGTSQAVPHVAGIVALMLQANATMTPVAVANALRASAIDLGEPGPDDAWGFGLVDARDAVRQATGTPNDRRNPLVAGGIERYEDEGRVERADDGPAGFLGGLVGGQEREVWSTRFPVKPGAAALTFDLSWSAPGGSPRVLVERDGATLGAWSRAQATTSGSIVSGRLDEPEPGVYALRVLATTPPAAGLAATVHVHLPANASRALELDSRYRLPEDAGAQAPLAPPLALVARHPGVVPAFLVGLLLALAWDALRRRRAASEPPDEFVL